MTILLDAGADIDVGINVRKTACYAAISHNRVDSLKLLLGRGARVNGAHLQAATNFAHDDKIILLLLDAGAPHDDLTNVELMDLVAKPSSVAVLKRLIARNIDVCALRGKYERTLCHYVTDRVEPDSDVDELIRALADGGIDVDAVDALGSTALQLGARKSCARVLVQLGADIDRANRSSHSALHLACGWSSHAGGACGELLLALGADVHLVNQRGQTASHFSAINRSRADLCACLAAGGDLDQPDSSGESVRTIASRCRTKLPTSGEIDNARRRIAKIRLDFVRQRALQICIGLQALNLNALELCEIMMYSFGALGSLIAFHQWWAIATKVKHFHNSNDENS